VRHGRDAEPVGRHDLALRGGQCRRSGLWDEGLVPEDASELIQPVTDQLPPVGCLSAEIVLMRCAALAVAGRAHPDADQLRKLLLKRHARDQVATRV
jgi:hypothetical protein